MNPLVTIIIITYNSESTIDEVVKSLLAQTYKNLEIIICDDFSTEDQTLNVLKKITDKRVKIIAGKKNLGPNGNTNRGLSCANGEFVCVAGGDDIFKENKIEKQVNFFISHDHVNLVCNGLSSAPSENQDKPSSNNIICDANKILNTPFYTVGAMIRWDKNNPIYTNERYITNDNIFYFTYMGRRGGSFAILSDRLSYYERTESGLNSSGPHDYARKIFIQWEILHSFTVLHIYSYFKFFEVLKFYLRSFTSLSLTIFRYCAFNLRQKWALKK